MMPWLYKYIYLYCYHYCYYHIIFSLAHIYTIHNTECIVRSRIESVHPYKIILQGRTDHKASM